MKSGKLLLLFCVCFSRYAFSGSQAPSPEAILGRCAQAMGSSQQHLPVIADGGLQEGGFETAIPVRVKTRGLEDFRAERGAAGETETSIISRGRGWHRGQAKNLTVPRHTTAYFKPDHLPALVCSADHASQGMRVIYAGEDTVGDRPVFHIKLDALPRGKNTQADLVESLISEYHIFIDQQSFTVLKTSKFIFSPDTIDNHSLWETLYSDYRRVNGVLMPFRIENLVSGRKFGTTVFTKITTDVALSDQEFAEAK
jgi:hypothetical protein